MTSADSVPKVDLLGRSPLVDPVRLDYGGVYACPICRHGQISGLVLTDAFGCNFCRHIFTANLNTQAIFTADSAQPLAWRWTGQHWRSLHRGNGELGVAIWIIGIALMVLPTTLIGSSIYLFPPLDGSYGAWFPLVWMLFSLVSHTALSGWLLAEYYQLPWYITLKFGLQGVWERMANFLG